ncbi:SurA N-terminal domain-containing protein [Thalassotalea sp. PLHSN55]|uniref:SurA N-terminal domain-containing protein n=1 Tax=Thalassotalea sp. PLHSN55 TaxID=3435888 RepID=UPI003F864869
MLENIRESSQGLTAKIILGFIILTFAVAGIGSYTTAVDTSVAEVNGEKISQADFNKAYTAQRNRMAQQFGEMFNTLSENKEYMANFRQGVLENAISEKLIDQSSRDLGIRVSDQRIKQTIRQMPEFQSDGVFDNNRYLAVINQAGFYQSSDFRDYLRVEMTRQQLTQSLVASEFNLPYQEEMLSALQNQQRDIRFATISAKQFEASVEVTDEELNSYYQANQAMFQNQEKVQLEYIALDVDEIAKGIAITDEEVETFYQENITSYTQEERRRVSHILVEFGDDQDASKEKIDAIAARIAQGEDFAALAQELSDDSFSGENGGDLEWLETGVMEEAFEESAFALTDVGSVSDVVETSFGYHLIKLTAIEAEKVKALADVQEELHAQLSSDKAQDKFFELQQEVARLSFEFPDSLEDAASAADLSVQTSPWLARGGNSAPFNNAQLMETAFSDIVILEQLNSDIVEVNDKLAVVVRLKSYQEATVKPLTEVQEGIKTTLVAQKSTEEAQTLAADLLAEFTSGADISAQLAEVNAAFEEHKAITRFGSAIDSSISKEAYVLPHPSEGNISAATVTLANGDLALLEVQAVSAVDAAQVDPSLAQQQVQMLAQSAYKSFVDALRAEAKITTKDISNLTVQNQY